MKLVPIDLDLCLSGYINSADGRIRPIQGVEELTRQSVWEGCSVFWDLKLPDGVQGMCQLWTGRIRLLPFLFDCPPWVLRRVWAHEIGHRVCGGSEEKAREFARNEYGERIEPEPVAWMRSSDLLLAGVL